MDQRRRLRMVKKERDLKRMSRNIFQLTFQRQLPALRAQHQWLFEICSSTSAWLLKEQEGGQKNWRGRERHRVPNKNFLVKTTNNARVPDPITGQPKAIVKAPVPYLSTVLQGNLVCRYIPHSSPAALVACLLMFPKKQKFNPSPSSCRSSWWSFAVLL